ncbi:MAG: lyase family protein [Thiolinea sp.]
MNQSRTEYDLLGTVSVPENALYGAQTQRAIRNFPVNQQPTIGDFPELIHGLLCIKQAAARTNQQLGLLSEHQANAIQAACKQIQHEALYAQFPLHYLHGGGGTSANMNVNEVIANLGEEILGGTRGDYQLLHPNDHVNLHQSTNDVYPTACHLAVISRWQTLKPALEALQDAFSRKIAGFGQQQRIARTCLQDAVAISFADFLGGYRAVIARSSRRLEQAIGHLGTVNLGGTIVGRAEDVPPMYLTTVTSELDKIYPHATIIQANNLFDAAQNPDDLVAVSAQLDLCARSLIKIAKDIRLLASGPEAGLGELSIPAVQPGSSIMPGKVNPVIPEFMIQVGFRVIGNHQMCAAALDHGELDLNVWESPIVFGILDSMGLLSDALTSFSENCIAGLEVSADTNNRKADSIIALLTELMKKHGYSTVSNICKEAEGDLNLVRQLIREQELN